MSDPLPQKKDPSVYARETYASIQASKVEKKRQEDERHHRFLELKSLALKKKEREEDENAALFMAKKERKQQRKWRRRAESADGFVRERRRKWVGGARSRDVVQ